MGRMQRAKGATYERWIANCLRKAYPKAKRGIGQARSASEVPDVDGVPFWVECKHQKLPNLFAALEQASKARQAWSQLAAAVGERPPLVVARRNHGRDVAVLHLDDLVKLLEELECLRDRYRQEPGSLLRRA